MAGREHQGLSNHTCSPRFLTRADAADAPLAGITLPLSGVCLECFNPGLQPYGTKLKAEGHTFAWNVPGNCEGSRNQNFCTRCCGEIGYSWDAEGGVCRCDVGRNGTRYIDERPAGVGDGGLVERHTQHHCLACPADCGTTESAAACT